jgi:hypothetical protein
LLIRDGRDTVESFSKSWGGWGAFRKMIKRWKERMDIIENFLEQSNKCGYASRVKLVRYDNLNDDTIVELRSIFEFLGLEAETYPWDKLNELPILGSSSFRNEKRKLP